MVRTSVVGGAAAVTVTLAWASAGGTVWRAAVNVLGSVASVGNSSRARAMADAPPCGLVIEGSRNRSIDAWYCLAGR
jgi:hypothetical protein